MFEDELFAELFNARCHDTGEPANCNLISKVPYDLINYGIAEKVKIFKDELLRLNQQKPDTLSLNSLRLGINSIISLSNTLPSRSVTFI